MPFLNDWMQAVTYPVRAVGGLFTSKPTTVSPNDTGAAFGLFEPVGGAQQEIDWDYSEPYAENTAGNRGCPVGYYTYYTPDGPVCRRYGYSGGKLTGYDPASAASDARTVFGSLTETVGSVTRALAAPVRQAQSWFKSIPWFKGSYVIIGILVAVALVLLMGSRLISKAEGR